MNTVVKRLCRGAVARRRCWYGQGWRGARYRCTPYGGQDSHERMNRLFAA